MFDLGIQSVSPSGVVLFNCGCERTYMESWQAHRSNPTRLSLCFDHTKLYERYLRYLCDLERLGSGTNRVGLTPPHRHTAMDR